MSTRAGVTSSFCFTTSEDCPGALEARLVISSETFELLEKLSMLACEGMGNIIAKGIALLSVAANAKQEGKVIGIGREGQPMETVIDVF